MTRTRARRHPRSAHRVLAAFCLLFAAGGARAQETQEPIRLPGVEVISTLPGPLDEIPGSSVVIDGDLLQTTHPLSPNEVLRHAPGLHLKEEDAFGLVLNVGARGLDPRRSSRTLLMEDGSPIHLGPYGDPTARYQPLLQTLDRIEVLKGSGQIRHGPHTVGAIVNFVTSNPPREHGGSLSLSGGNREFWNGHLTAGGTWGATGLLLNVGHLQGDGVRKLDRHRVEQVMLKGTLAAADGQSLTLKASFHENDTEGGEAALTQAEFEEDPFGNPFASNSYFFRRWGGQGVHELPFSDDVVLRTNAYAQRASITILRQARSSDDRFGTPDYAETFNCPPAASGPEDCGNQGLPRTYTFAGVEPRLSASHRLLGLESESEVGVRAHFETVVRKQFAGEESDSRAGETTRDNRIDTQVFAGFVQNRARLGRWTVVPGLRLEHVRASNENRIQGSEAEETFTKTLPGLGVTLQALDDVSLFAGAHRGFAPPRPAEVLQPAPGEGLIQLDPEVSWNYEAGVRAHPAAGLSVEATLFRIDFDNQVVSGNLAGSGQTLVNAGETLHEGLEVAARFDLAEWLGESLGVYAEAAYTNVWTAEFRDDRLSVIDEETAIGGNRLPYAPEHLLSGGLGYAAPFGLDLRLGAEYVGEQFTDDLNTVEGSPNGQQGLIPDYTIVNAAANYTLPRSVVTLYGAVKNLTDEVYIADRQEGIVVGPGRRMTLGAKWSF